METCFSGLRNGGTEQAHVISWRDDFVSELKWRSITAHWSGTILGSSPEDLRLVCVQLESIHCHPVAHTCNAHFQSLDGRRHVLLVTLEM